MPSVSIMLKQLRSFLPETSPATKILLGIIVGLFVIMTIDGMQHFSPNSPLSVITSPPGELMKRWGVHLQGEFEPWRIITSIIVHFGIVHLLFNSYALHVVGPHVESWYGSAVMWAAFVFTGVGAAAASNLMGPGAYAAGASGGLMGLIGLMAVAGHREGSEYGRAVRDVMVRWGFFTMLLGLLISGIDNIAHGAGLALGAGVAVLLPRPGRRPSWFLPAQLAAMITASLVLVTGVVGMGFNQKHHRALQSCLDEAKEGTDRSAVNTCEQVLEALPREPMVYHQLAWLYVHQNRRDDAHALYARARKTLNPRNVDALGALTFNRCHDFLTLLTDTSHEVSTLQLRRLLFCEEAVELVPKDPGAYHNLAKAYGDLGMPLKAVELCQVARERFTKQELLKRGENCLLKEDKEDKEESP